MKIYRSTDLLKMTVKNVCFTTIRLYFRQAYAYAQHGMCVVCKLYSSYKF